MNPRLNVSFLEQIQRDEQTLPPGASDIISSVFYVSCGKKCCVGLGVLQKRPSLRAAQICCSPISCFFESLHMKSVSVPKCNNWDIRSKRS